MNQLLIPFSWKKIIVYLFSAQRKRTVFVYEAIHRSQVVLLPNFSRGICSYGGHSMLAYIRKTISMSIKYRSSLSTTYSYVSSKIFNSTVGGCQQCKVSQPGQLSLPDSHPSYHPKERTAGEYQNMKWDRFCKKLYNQISLRLFPYHRYHKIGLWSLSAGTSGLIWCWTLLKPNRRYGWLQMFPETNLSLITGVIVAQNSFQELSTFTHAWL